MSELVTERINFDDLTPVEVEVSIAGKKYILREATGDAACKYRNALLRATKMVDGKVSGIEGMADVEPLLVSLCLFAATDKGVGSAVPVATIRSWPARVQKTLFEMAKKISELGEKEDKDVLTKRLADTQTKLDALSNGDGDAPKNEHSALPVGSS